jgi:hypothetical protein
MYYNIIMRKSTIVTTGLAVATMFVAGTLLFAHNYAKATDPIPGVDVKLGKNPGANLDRHISVGGANGEKGQEIKNSLACIILCGRG